MNILKNLLNKLGLKISSSGKNNIVQYPSSVKFKKTKINIWGNNNTVIIDENTKFSRTHIKIGFPDCPANNCVIKIGKNNGFSSVFLQLAENESSINIGDNCMITFDTEIVCSDTHCIFDENNNLLNIGKNITIGSHVRICKEVKIMKNTAIPDGCIDGLRSVITKKFTEPNCVIAGNPAKIVKTNVYWDYERPIQFLAKNESLGLL